MECPRCGKTHATKSEIVLCLYPDAQVLRMSETHMDFIIAHEQLHRQAAGLTEEERTAGLHTWKQPFSIFQLAWELRHKKFPTFLTTQEIYDMNVGVGAAELERWYNVATATKEKPSNDSLDS